MTELLSLTWLRVRSLPVCTIPWLAAGECFFSHFPLNFLYSTQNFALSSYFYRSRKLRDRTSVEHSLAHIGQWQDRKALILDSAKIYSICDEWLLSIILMSLCVLCELKVESVHMKAFPVLENSNEIQPFPESFFCHSKLSSWTTIGACDWSRPLWGLAQH